MRTEQRNSTSMASRVLFSKDQNLRETFEKKREGAGLGLVLFLHVCEVLLVTGFNLI